MKRINELTAEELTTVFENNKILRERLYDSVSDDANYWVENWLGSFERGAIDYSLDISGYYNYFSVCDNGKFLEGMKEVQSNYYAISDEWNKTIKYAYELVNRLEYMEYDLSDRDYERLSGRIEELVEDIRREFYREIRAAYDACDDEQYQLEYFLDCYAETLTNDYYVDDEYKLYQTITKCYA